VKGFSIMPGRPLALFWFLPTSGDGFHPGTEKTNGQEGVARGWTALLLGLLREAAWPPAADEWLKDRFR
jgi:hypothetical protein